MKLVDGKKEILDGLKPLFKEAKEKGLWFYHNGLCTGEIYFSPKELKEQHKEGKFLWGAVNWSLIDPETIAKRLRTSVTEAEANLERFLNRLRG